MPEVKTSRLLQAPAGEVWALLADFGAIARWWPKDGAVVIDEVVVEGSGIGMVRHIRNRSSSHAVSERLDFLEEASRTIVLSIIGERPVGIDAYVAEGHVHEVDSDTCRMDYRALVMTASGRDELVGKAIMKTWSLMFRGLESSAGLGP
jgi:uncharacterized protein YndB with AHSA1/START domain